MSPAPQAWVVNGWTVFAHPLFLAQLQALARGPVPVTPLIVAPRAHDVPGVRVVVDAQGWIAKRYDGQAGTTYLLRPDQHVAARWRQLSAAQVQQAVARATCNA